MRNTEPHQKWASRRPPTIGPRMAPTVNPPAQMPTATPICLGSRNMVLISASVEGASVDPATPSSARAPISIAGLVANAESRDAIAKHAAPIISSFRRPIRSPSVPIVMRKPATRKP
jgi:hypothetical protein